MGKFRVDEKSNHTPSEDEREAYNCRDHSFSSYKGTSASKHSINDDDDRDEVGSPCRIEGVQSTTNAAPREEREIKGKLREMKTMRIIH